MMIRIFYCLFVVIPLFSCTPEKKIHLEHVVGNCLRDIVNMEISVAYNYLQLSSKVGAQNAYPGFSSLFTKLSDEDFSKGHELVKFIALRRAELSDQLIQEKTIKSNVSLIIGTNIPVCLEEARKLNKEIWDTIKKCHEIPDHQNDANVQDYLESHLLEHHIEVEKLLIDLDHRINHDQTSDKALITFMIDEELLQTYGDRRKDIFS